MTTRAHDEADRADADIERPGEFGTEDENEPTVTRISRADLHQYSETSGGTPASQPTPREHTARGPVSATRPKTGTAAFGEESGEPTQMLEKAEVPTVRSAPERETVDPTPVTVPLVPPRQTARPTAAPTPTAERTTVMAPADPWQAEDADRAEDGAEPDQATVLAERRADRDRALGKRRPQPAPVAVADPPSTRLDRTTDRFPVASGVFLLRLAVAAVMGVRGAQQLMDIPGTIAMFAGTALPYPEIFAWATAAGSVLIAVALVFGLATRIAGLGTMLISIGALVFVYWWKSPFEPGVAGFHGETELLLAVLGFFLLMTGGGSWGIDAAVRKSRLQRKAEKYDAELI